TSRRGNVRVKASLSTSIKPGCVFLPMHWGKLGDTDLHRANNLTNPLLDPISKEPDFKFCAVQVVPYEKPFERIVIVGAGAGAFGFVKAFREINTRDEITVISNENLPFYNRVMLPHYVSGDQQWEELVKMRDEEEKNVYNINHIRGVTVTRIDREFTYVEDSRGMKAPYDSLMLGTGSRSAMLKDIPTLPGIFSIRHRSVGGNLRKFLRKDASVVIIGGGLLGLEMAASLREMDVRVTVVQRVSRFLNRQFDVLVSQLLHEEMIDQGCDVFYNDEVQLYYGRNKVNKVE